MKDDDADVVNVADDVLDAITNCNTGNKVAHDIIIDISSFYCEEFY